MNPPAQGQQQNPYHKSLLQENRKKKKEIFLKGLRISVWCVWGKMNTKLEKEQKLVMIFRKYSVSFRISFCCK